MESSAICSKSSRKWSVNSTRSRAAGSPASRPFRQKLADVHAAHREAEDALEVRDHGSLHVLEIDWMSEAFLQGGHDSAVMAAGPNLEELPQVRRHIEREAVERHAPPHREPDRGDLLVPHPDAPLGSLPGRVDPEVGTGTEEHLLEVRHELFHLEAVRESEDRIADELAGPVIGRLAAPFDLHDLQARIEDVLPLPTTAEGRDGRDPSG